MKVKSDNNKNKNKKIKENNNNVHTQSTLSRALKQGTHDGAWCEKLLSEDDANTFIL